MKKIYRVFIAIVVIILCVQVFIFQEEKNEQINNYRNRILIQGKNCVSVLGKTDKEFEGKIRKIILSGCITKIIGSQGKDNEPIENLKLLFASYPNLISGISIYDTVDHSFSLDKDKEIFMHNFYTTHSQHQLIKKETLITDEDQTYINYPVFEDNKLIANLIITINPFNYLDLLLKDYQENPLYFQEVCDTSGKLIYSNSSRQIKDSVLFTKNLLQTTGFFKSSCTTSSGKITLNTALYKLHFANIQFILAFSLDIDQLIAPILVRNFISFIIFLVLIGFLLYYVSVKLKEKDKEIKKGFEAEASMMKIFNSIPIGVMILNQDKTIIHINNTASELLFGKNSEGAVGRNVSEMIIQSNFWNKVKPDTAYDTSHFYAFEKEGSEITIYKKDIPFNLSEEQLIIEAFIDVTPIEKARKLEAAANLAKSDFLAKMSHEIRTPMNGIVGMADALLRQTLTPEQKEFAEIIKKSSDLLLTIINDILDFSKVEAGKMMLEEIPFKISDEINLVRELFKPMAEHKRLKIVTEIAPDVPNNIIGDPFRLRQVTTNLMSNAIKFTQEGEIHIRIELLESYSGHLTLQFTIEDTGIGIPKDKIDTIFSSYIQVEGSTTRKYGGTGLGTTISKQLVELMGGEIWAESPSSISENPAFPGSKFTFTIEVYSNEMLPKNINLSNITEYSQINALIITPSAKDNEPIYTYFDNFGIRFEKYELHENGNHELFAKLKIDGKNFQLLIIVDSLNFDGFRIAKLLHDKGLLNHFICILISSNDIIGNYIRARRLDVDYYLIKPYESSEIFDLIQNNFKSIEPDAGIPAKLNKIRKSINILVAEDNMINQKVAKTIFKNLGYEIALVANGNEAVKEAMSRNYDIVFMDIMMPEKDGVQATKELRIKGFKSPIIAMTANATKEGKNKAISFGMDGYITKPTKMEAIKKILIKYFSEPL